MIADAECDFMVKNLKIDVSHGRRNAMDNTLEQIRKGWQLSGGESNEGPD
jgi:hypothetical protein